MEKAMVGTMKCRTYGIALGMLLCAQVAHAASECEQNYSSSPGSNGGVIHQSFVGLYGADKTAVTSNLAAMAKRQKFQLIQGPSILEDGLITMVYAQEASATARGFPVVMMVAPDTDAAVISFELPKGMTAPDAKGSVCSFFADAKLDGQPANASRRNADRNSALAKPLLAALNGGMSADEAAKASVTAKRETAVVSAGDDRGAAPEIADRRKVVTPKTTYTPTDADTRLQSEGSSTIRGFTCGRVMTAGGSQFQTTPNQGIMLFPYTPYLKEAIDLIDANRNKGAKVRVDVDKRAFASGLAGKTNANGEFMFTRIKPGRYIVMALFHGEATSYITTPQSQYDQSTRTIYQWTEHERVDTSSSDILQADVTINRDGEVIDGVVVKPTGNGRLLPVLNGVCKWHHAE
ncbi:hypothetical protein [Xanthomonas sacchari]|uniref:hypothetical protein n=1 Tax=Xanthomonas sacchari TaxID=56458 RepID=UPI0012E083CF|nr:hypothetical protein [Xanthomonas sacchari]